MIHLASMITRSIKLFILLLLTLSSCSAQQSNDGAIITGISGCTYQSIDRTIDCPRPVTLTISGSGFLNGVDEDPLSADWLIGVFIMHGPGESDYYRCQLMNVTDSLIDCYFDDPGFKKVPELTPLNVTFVNWVVRDEFTLPYAISFAYETFPVVDSVEGCQSSNQRSAYGCDINQPITIRGSSFYSVDHGSAYLRLGSASRYLMMVMDHQLIDRYDNNTIIFNFRLADWLYSEIGASNGSPITFWIDGPGNGEISWSTEPVFVSFLPLPAPRIRSVEQKATWKACVVDHITGSDRYRDCVPGFSQLHITGDFLFRPLVVSVGGAACSEIYQEFDGSWSFKVPMLKSVANVFYDLSVSTSSGTFTLPAMIGFSRRPFIANTVACVDTGYPYFQSMCLAGETILLKVYNAEHLRNPRVLLISVANTSHIIECQNPQLIDSETISCTVPEHPPEMPSTINMQVTWQDGEMTDTVPMARFWASTDAPRISSLSGCYSDSGNPLHLNQCLNQTSYLTIHGVRLNIVDDEQKRWKIQVEGVLCSSLVSINNETVTCQLPWVGYGSNSLKYDEKYRVRIIRSMGNLDISNVGYITFVKQETHPSSTTSSSTSTTVALATVFSIVGALFIVALAFVLLRVLKQRQSESQSQFMSEFNSPIKHIELEEV